MKLWYFSAFREVFNVPFSIDQAAGESCESELVYKILDDLLRVEISTGEDVDIHITPFHESVEADVALSNKNKAGNSPILWFTSNVSKYNWPLDFGHPNFGGIWVQQLIYKLLILHYLFAAVSINGQVHISS